MEKLHHQRVLAQKLSFCIVVTVISLAFHRIVKCHEIFPLLNFHIKNLHFVFSFQILDFLQSSETYASILNVGCTDTQILDVSTIFFNTIMNFIN
jgi:ABC-type amino acid transport system permease subunit